MTLVDDKEYHTRRRQLYPAFSDKALRGYEHRILGHVRQFCTLLYPRHLGQNEDKEKGEWGPAMKMSDWCSYLTFDIMADIIFGAKHDLLNDDTHRSIIGDIEESNVRTTVLMQIPWLYLGRMDRKLFPESIKSRIRYLKLVDKMVSNHVQGKMEQKEGTIFSLLSQGEQKLRDADLHSEATHLTIAGMVDMFII
ncbi:hypothetical protein AWENTII_004896 [Aspergillus wentii]